MIEVKCGQFRSDQVGFPQTLAGASFSGDRILLCVVELRIEESAGTVHIGGSDVRIPVHDRAKPCPGMQVYTTSADAGRISVQVRLPSGRRAFTSLD